MRQAPFEARNQTPKAKRKVRKLAVEAGLPEPLVVALVGLSRNYDDDNFCWVPENQKNEVPDSVVQILEEGLGWPRNKVLSRDEVISQAMEFAARGLDSHVSRFLAAVPARNRWAMSPLMTCATLRGLSSDLLSHCSVPDSLDFSMVCDHASAKLGVSLAPLSDLGFAVVEAATLALGTAPEANDGQWLHEVCADIEALGPGSKLADLIKATSKSLGGNKATRTHILEALGLVGVLRTDAFDPEHDFLPAVRRDSSHFYSNEWRFPMNFWAESGRVAGVDVLLGHALKP